MYKKKLGQHFLKDKNLIKRIAQAGNVSEGDIVIEIGPGLGFLTEELILRGAEVYAFEIDNELYSKLKDKNIPSLHLFREDFLNTDLSTFRNIPQKIKLISNIPYYITTPILLKILKHISLFSIIIITVQKEYALRLTALYGTTDYSSITIISNLLCNIKILFNIPPGAFNPIPDVHSSVIMLEPKLNPILSKDNINDFSRFTMSIFSKRRKTLKNAIRNLIETINLGKIEESGFNLNARPETLTPEEFFKLFNLLKK